MMNKMPILFIGHGSPMNALETNEFNTAWKQQAKNIPTPQAILCISAHWCTEGTRITSHTEPYTIHDFYGFPKELNELIYSAPGNLHLAKQIQDKLGKEHLQLDETWGLDHGTWSLLVHMYPEADIPVLQLSLDLNKSPEEHYQFAKKLAYLREQNIVILGSGNIVHNLHNIDPERDRTPFTWAEGFDSKVKRLIIEHNHTALLHHKDFWQEAYLSIPTNEHYLPLLYILSLQEKGETLTFFTEKIVHGSISMRSVRIG